MSVRKFNTGDKVKVTKGKFLGLEGKITAYTYSRGRVAEYTVKLNGSGSVYLPSNYMEKTVSKESVAAPKGKIEVDEAFIKEAHKSACSDWKKKIEKKFPTVFPKSKRYKFGMRVTITTDLRTNTPIRYIADGVAPDGEECEWLVINDGWRMVTKEHDGRRLIGFEKI